MKNAIQSRLGFTLIELLVVVLIIGILAAVALPQYQFAVAKSRLMSLMPIARNVKLAIQRYYWANNRYPTSFDELDIDLPCLEEGSNPCYLSKDVYVQLVGYYTNILDQRVKGTRFVYFYSGPGTCYAYDTPNKDFSNRLCKSISGKEPFESEGGSNRYIVWED